MANLVSTAGLWGCAVLGVLATAWGVGVLVAGRAPRRELHRFRSVAQYGRYCVGLGMAFGLIALSSGLGGWFRLLTVVALGILAWSAIRIWHPRNRPGA